MHNYNEKEELYFIPGTQCDEALWSLVEPYLKDKFESHYLSIPLEKSMDDTINAMANLLPKKPIRLVGFSLGGYLATCLADLRCECISKLHIISNTPSTLSRTEQKNRSTIITYLESTSCYHGVSTAKAEEMIDKDHPHKQKLIKIIQDMDRRLGKAHLLSQLIVTSARKDQSENIKNMPFEVSFLVSKQDPLIDNHWLYNLEQSAQNVKVEYCDGRGHMLPMEAPLLVAKWLMESS